MHKYGYCLLNCAGYGRVITNKKRRQRENKGEGEKGGAGGQRDTVYIYTIFLSSTASRRDIEDRKTKNEENKAEKRTQAEPKHTYNHPGSRKTQDGGDEEGERERI